LEEYGIGRAKTAEPIELPFGAVNGMGQGIVYQMDVHICANW